MITLLMNWAILTGAVLIASVLLLPVMKLKSWKTAILVAGLFGLLKAVLFRFLLIVTLPLNAITLGLFTFVLLGLLLWITDKLLDDLHIKSFGWTIVTAAVITGLDRFGHFLFG